MRAAGEVERTYSNLTKAQHAALGEVAFPMRDFVQINPATARVLIARGLISRARTFQGNMTIEHHVMTIPQHMDYCEWCASQPDTTTPDTGRDA